MKLSKWAKDQGVAYGTALKWFHEHNLPFRSEQLKSGSILVYPCEDVNRKINKTFVYSRVSNNAQRENLHSQAGLCQQYCLAKGWKVDKTVKDVASGMNDNRPHLNKILSEKNIRLVCLHKDRLTRFGFQYIKRVIEANGGQIEIINPEATDEEDLIKDFAAIITSFCCRLYGARRGQAKALKMKEAVRGED